MGEITIEELKQKKIWFLWNYMPGKNGKITKIPFSAYGGATGTDDKYRDTWATYDEAYAAMHKCGASGLGFKVPEGVYFLDIDHWKNWKMRGRSWVIQKGKTPCRRKCSGQFN